MTFARRRFSRLAVFAIPFDDRLNIEPVFNIAHSFEGLELQERLEASKVSARCGLLVIELTSGDVVQWLRVEEPVRELYDVLVLLGMHRPKLVGFKTDEIRTRVWANPAALQRLMAKDA